METGGFNPYITNPENGSLQLNPECKLSQMTGRDFMSQFASMIQESEATINTSKISMTKLSLIGTRNHMLALLPEALKQVADYESLPDYFKTGIEDLGARAQAVLVDPTTLSASRLLELNQPREGNPNKLDVLIADYLPPSQE